MALLGKRTNSKGPAYIHTYHTYLSYCLVYLLPTCLPAMLVTPASHPAAEFEFISDRFFTIMVLRSNSVTLMVCGIG